jgi:hypothetical protein
MLKPICIPCQRFFRKKKSGFYFTEGMPANGQTRPQSGLAEPQNWKPYKIWSGDIWECKGCGAKIISSVGSQPVNEHYVENFELCRKQLGADQFQVNDC